MARESFPPVEFQPGFGHAISKQSTATQDTASRVMAIKFNGPMTDDRQDPLNQNPFMSPTGGFSRPCNPDACARWVGDELGGGQLVDLLANRHLLPVP